MAERTYKANDVQIGIDTFLNVGLVETTMVETGYVGNLARDIVSEDGKLLAREGDHVVADGKGGYNIETSVDPREHG